MTDLVDRIRAALRAAADPSRAPAQQAYMKSAMPFLGVRLPEVRRIVREQVRAAGRTGDGPGLAAASLTLWDEATRREERYAAAELLAERALRGEWSLVPQIEHMARSGAWWDHVDGLAHRMAALHDAHPVATGALVRGWALDDDLWIRRLAIISQLGRGERLDRDLLAATIEPNLGDGEFFIRKAIGWALRDAARRHPGWVRAFVAHHPLSPLSRREALKHLTVVAGDNPEEVVGDSN